MPSLIHNATVKVSNFFYRWMGEHMCDNQVFVENTESQIRIETEYYPITGYNKNLKKQQLQQWQKQQQHQAPLLQQAPQQQQWQVPGDAVQQ